MATGLSIASTSNFSSGQKVLVADAKMAYEAAAPDPDLIDQHRIPQGHKQWDILTYARLTSASALTEGVDLSSSQQLVAASLSITPTEHGVIATLSNRLVRRQGDANVVSSAGRMLANSLRRRQALDVISLYDGFSKSSPGSGALDITTFRGAVAYLLTDNDAGYGPAPLPLHAALHIEHISDVIEQITDTAPRGTASGFTDDLLQRWWKGSDRLYGVQVFHSGLIERASDSTAKGGLFAKEALAMVMANNADVTEQQDHSLRAVEYGIFQEWGEGERADVHGIEILADAASTL